MPETVASSVDAFCEKFGLVASVQALLPSKLRMAGGPEYPFVSATASRQDLCELFAALGYRHGVEIGVWEGLFSEQICKANPGVELLCVDPWQQYPAYNERKNNQERLAWAYDQARTRLAPYGCQLRRSSSVAAAPHVTDGSLDFAYIDGNHYREYVTADLDAWVPKVRSGGIIAGHDYELPHLKAPWIDVRDAVLAYTREHQIQPWYVLARERKAPSFFWVKP